MNRTAALLCALLAIAGCRERSTPPEPSVTVTVTSRMAACSLTAGQVSCRAKKEMGKELLADGAELQVDQRIPFADLVVELIEPLSRGACAVTEARDVYCWGDVMVDGPEKHRRVFPPAKVRGLSDAQTVVMTMGAVCAIRRDRSVWCAGVLLGIEAQPDFMTAQAIPVPPATAIAADFIQTCVVGREGVRCWGGHRPVHGRQRRLEGITLIEGTQDVRRLRAEDGMMCAIYPDGLEECWSTTPSPLR